MKALPFFLAFPGLLAGGDAVARDNWHERFCIEAQQIMAGTSLIAALEIHDDMDSFVKSGATDTPFTVHAFLSNPEADSGMARTLSCKMRMAERINAVQGRVDRPAPASGDTDCTFVHRRMVERVAADIGSGGLKVDPKSIIYQEDHRTYIGPHWLDPWPFNAAELDPEGRLTLQGRALYAPHAWWIPMPDRFKGNYYCHLVAPDYLEALLRGQTAPQPVQ